MVYDSIHVLCVVEEEEVDVPRERSYLRASATMRSHGLWLNHYKRIVGVIFIVCIWDVFLYRIKLISVGLHGLPQVGINYLQASMSLNGEPIPIERDTFKQIMVMDGLFRK
jgi:euchromatic histone-lysine N-methyltransferase